MRLGTRSSNEFINFLNVKNEEIQKKFSNIVKDRTKTAPIKVMLGDSTVMEQKTFDPKLIEDFFRGMTNKLSDWSFQEVSTSNNEDIRRIFSKMEVREGNYLISVHLSLQFHVLLYYKPDNRVIQCQKELSDLLEKTKTEGSDFAKLGDQFVIARLREMGYCDLNHQDLFELFFENDGLREKIYREIEEKTDLDFKKIAETKAELFKELDSYLLEIYQTSPVLIDDTRLVAGEEGHLCSIDIEFIKKQTKEGLFDPKRISEIVKKRIIDRLDQLEQSVNL